MKRMAWVVAGGCILLIWAGCNANRPTNPVVAVQPTVVTGQLPFDADDPAIWINAADPSASRIVGTDKHSGGSLYLFDLKGKILAKTAGLARPNNVDIAYQVPLGNRIYDIAAVTEREGNRLRFFSVPDLTALDSTGIEVFEGEAEKGPMGIAFFKRPSDGTHFVIISRKKGPAEGYLWQYELVDEAGRPGLKLVRKFGRFSGKKEIESIAVDAELGYVYYSDEQVGIRKYFADPDKGNQELALFGAGDFKADNEGISIYKLDKNTGYILVSDQSNKSFNVYPREGAAGDPHQHDLVTTIPVSTEESDGSETSSFSLPGFEGGIFVAMSTDKTFQYYRWTDLAQKAGLKIKK